MNYGWQLKTFKTREKWKTLLKRTKTKFNGKKFSSIMNMLLNTKNY